MNGRVTKEVTINHLMHQDLENTFLTALEQHQQKLLRICSVYAENADDKKDLFQEAVINIWEAMPSFEAKSSLSTWMFRITINVCLRLQSKHANKKNRFLNMDSVRIENMADDETGKEDRELLTKLRSCIKALNDADRAIVTLYLEELPYKEIAEITGVTENHVAVLVKRIKEKLSNCIIGKS